MRGSIKLHLLRTTFSPGDAITGYFELQTKKAIEGNKLTVSLIGTQVTKTREGGKTRTRSREIYREELLLEGENTYRAGHRDRYDFDMVAPDSNAPQFMNSPLGQALTSALRALGGNRSRLDWRVEARLDARGVDLAASAKVTINTSSFI